VPRLTKIYTRKGDQGFTSLRNQSVAKDDSLIEAVGTLDELNATLGLILASPDIPSEINAVLTKVQNDLFDMGGELHLPERIAITATNVTWLEQRLDNWNDALPPLQEFILPRGNMGAVSAHLARTICRRAERNMVHLHRQTPLSNLEILRYLNRLSDLLFVIARVLARTTNTHEKMWEHE
jgi:cob(I)alamin adenosyltransferase